MKKTNFWNKLKGWQKGAIIGGIAGAIFIIIVSIIESSSRVLEQSLFLFIFFAIPVILLGMFIGSISSSIKMKKNPVFLVGILGLVVGAFSVLLFETRMGKIFIYPLIALISIIKHFFPSSGLRWLEAGPILVLIHILLWALFGLIIGFIIYLIKRGRK